MASIWFSPEVGGFVTRVAGTDRVVPLGGTEYEAMGQSFQDQQNDFAYKNEYDKRKDYSDSHAGLFGSGVDQDNAMYYDGPNARWQGAMMDRLRQREQGDYNYGGRYESSTRGVDRELQSKMYARNNAIEDMYRKGYSWDQINAHVEGKANALEAGPDWADFNKRRDEYLATLGEGETAQKQWFDSYYKGADKSHYLSSAADYDFSGSTGGFMGGFGAEGNTNVPAPAAPAQKATQRPSVGGLFESFMKAREERKNGRS